MLCLGVCFLGSKFFGTLWASWTSQKSISFGRFGKLSFIIFSHKFSISCSSSFPSGTPMIWMLECLKFSRMFLNLSSFFDFLFLHSVLVECLFLLSAPYHYVSPTLLPFMAGSLYIFLYFTLHSLHFLLYLVTIFNHFCEHPDYQFLNSASDRLAMSSSLSSIFGALIYSFIWAIFLCLSAPVWMNGSSLTPWLSDFHTIQFSGTCNNFLLCFFLVLWRGKVYLLMPPSFNSFSSLMAVSRTSNAVFNRSGASRHPYLALDLRRKAFTFCTFNVKLAVGFS